MTQSYTWRELVELYRLTQPARNLRPRYNIAPTTAIDRAASALSSARSSAEVLEARDIVGFAYDLAKRTGRLAKAKDAHDVVIGAAYRAQADALVIESEAKRRLADEYDDAQKRGEVGRTGRPKSVPDENAFSPATAADIGLTRKEIFEAREIRDAEAADPGIVRRVVEERIAGGEEPTKAVVREAIRPGAHAADPANATRMHNRRGSASATRRSGIGAFRPDRRRQPRIWAGTERDIYHLDPSQRTPADTIH